MLVFTNFIGVLILLAVIAIGVFAGNALDKQAHKIGAWLEKAKSADRIDSYHNIHLSKNK